MAYAITLELSGDRDLFDRAARAHRNPRELMLQIGARGVSRGQERLVRQLSSSEGVSQGRLLASLQLFEVSDRSVSAGSNLRYAAQRQFGGIIEPKQAKALAIPLTEDLQRHGLGPLEIDPSRELLQFVPSGKKPNVFGVLVNRKIGRKKAISGHPSGPLFALAYWVNQPARPYMFWDEEDKAFVRNELYPRFLGIHATIDGSSDVAGQLKNIAEAQRDAAAVQVNEAAPAATKLEEAQRKLNISSETYVGLLNKIAPRLGEWASAARRAIIVAGDLASKNVDLSKVASAGIETFTKYAGAVKLLGAGAVAYGGFSFLISKIREAREEAQAATKAFEAMVAAQTKAQQAAQAGAADVAASRAASGRAPFSAAQQLSIEQTLQAAPNDVRGAIKPIAEVLGGAQGFGEGAGPFTGGELESLARLGFKVPEGATPERAAARARRFLDRNRQRVEQLDQAQRELGESRLDAAAGEAMNPAAGQGHLRTIVEEAAEEFGADPDVLMERTTAAAQRQARFVKDFGSVPHTLQQVREQNTEAQLLPDVESQGRRVTPIEAGAVDQIIARLLPRLEKLLTQQRPVTVNQHFSPRNYSSDADAQRRRERNGDSVLNNLP